MLQRIVNLLQAILQKKLPARFSYTEEPAKQVVREQNAHPVSTMEEDLNVMDPVSIMSLLARERTTGPFRVLVRLKNPAQRYQDLDAMLEMFRRERLNDVETEFAMRLQRKIDHEES